MKKNQKKFIAFTTALTLIVSASCQIPAEYFNVFADDSDYPDLIEEYSTELIPGLVDGYEHVRIIRDSNPSDYTISGDTMIVRTTDSTGAVSNVAKGLGYLDYKVRDAIKNIKLEYGITYIYDYALCDFIYAESIKIPSSVVYIGEYAFAQLGKCAEIEEIVIPESVHTIESSAFRKVRCKNFTLNSVENIKEYTFNDSVILENLSISNVKNIENYAFGNSSFKKLDLTNCPGVSLGSQAFVSNTELEHVVLPESLGQVENNIFGGDSSLNTVEYSDLCDLKAITDSMFSGCSNLKSMHSTSASNIDNNTIYIPSNVEKIDYCAFYNCISMEKVWLPSSVNSIGDFAFSGCKALSEITIPSSVTSISKNAFNNCDSLTIYGYKGSYAESYANENNIPFIALSNKSETSVTEATVTDVSVTEDTAAETTTAAASSDTVTEIKSTDETTTKAEETVTDISISTSEAKSSSIESGDVTAQITTAESVNTDNTSLDTSEVIYGDANGDGVADLTDLTLLSVYLMTKDPKNIKSIMNFDVDGNGVVDIADLPRFKQYVSKDASVPFLGPNK